MKNLRYLFTYMILCMPLMVSAQYSYWSRKTDIDKVHLEPRIQVANRIDEVVLSNDGKYALTWGSGFTSHASLWETASGKIVRTFDAMCHDACFSEFEPHILYISSYRSDIGSPLITGLVEVWDARTGEHLGYSTARDHEYLAKKGRVHPPYKAIVNKNGGTVDIISTNMQEKVSSLHSPALGLNGDIIVSPNGKYLLFTGIDAFVWDIEHARIHANIPFREYVGEAIDTKKMGWKMWVSGGFVDDEHVWLGAYQGKVSRWHINGRFEGEESYQSPIVWGRIKDRNDNTFAATCHGIQVNDKLVMPEKGYKLQYCVLDVPVENRVYGCGDGGVFCIDKRDLGTIKEALPLRTSMFCLALSPDGKHMLIGSEGSGVYMHEVGNDETKYTRYRPTENTIRACAFIDNETFVVGTQCDKGTLEYFRIGEQKPFKIADGHGGGVRSIAVDTIHRLIYTAAKDMEFRVWNMDSKELVSTIIPLENRNYIIYTPDGYIKTSPEAAKYIMFGKGMQLYDYEQFEWRYNRPDIIAARHGAKSEDVQMLYAAYQKRLRRMGLTESSSDVIQQMPSLKINTPAVTTVPSAQQSVSAQMHTPVGYIQSINVWINGTPIHDACEPIAKGKSDVTAQLYLDLVPGENHVEVSCMNSYGVESLRESWDVIVTEPATTPTRWIVSIGVSRYKDAAHNLTYAAKDARDIASLVANDKLKEKINTMTWLMVDSMVTRQSIKDIKQWLLGASRTDEVVIYYAGHGLLDDQMDYYLSTHDMDFRNPSARGIAYDELDDILNQIKPLKKMLIIDACHAGEIDKQELSMNMTQNKVQGEVRFRGNSLSLNESMQKAKEVSLLMGNIFADSRRGCGATVLVSASGVEVAMESEKWGNGLFTYVIKQAIGSGKADTNKDGQITTNELTNYVITQVEQLSNGAQNPVLRNFNYNNSISFKVKK